MAIEDSAKPGVVRTLIPDTEAVFGAAENETLFSDGDINNFLLAGGGSVLRAAGLACMAIGSSEALISKVIKTQDLATDGAKIQDSFTNKAKVLFARADKEDEDAGYYFDIIDFPITAPTPELTEHNWTWSY